MTFRQLQYIVAVADLGGFRRAAEACHVAQPSLSSQVAQAEQALGVVVFERHTNPIRVAPAARPLVERARELLTAAHDLIDQARVAADPLSGTLRIGVIPTVCPYLLPEVAPLLSERFPRLRLLWTEEKTRAIVSALEQGGLDAAIVAAGEEVEHLAAVHLGVDPFVLAGAPGHPLLADPQPAAAAELEGARVLLLEDGHCFRDQALALCEAAGATETEFRATSLSTLVQMVRAQSGVTVLPSLALPVENRRAQLGVRPFGPGGPSRTLLLVWRKGAPLGDALTEVARVLASGLAPLDRPAVP
ncbi:MAG: LysR family transcriptional regulator [Acidobacteria bacterium]|nr:LysR family transcriptional regulator [Acidobacteriota bacterium]